MSSTYLPGHDETLPTAPWTFDQGVTDVFANMLARSIPQYDLMRALSFSLGQAHVVAGTSIVDLGCSRGDALAPFVARNGTRNTYLGVECADPMIAAARARFADQPMVTIAKLDLRREFPDVQPRASLVLAVFTLQFVPIEYRQHVLAQIYRSLWPGGALVYVEKILGATAHIDGLLVRDYLAMKAEHGYTQEQIDRKRLSLEGVLVPLTAAWNEQLLRETGFAHVDCFWRCLNFAGWLAIKR